MSASRSAQIQAPYDLMAFPSQWLTDNWEAVVVASVAGAVLYLVLEALRLGAIALCKRLAARPHSVFFFTLLHRAAARTSHVFLVLAAARMVVGYADPPPQLFQTVNFVFTVAAVLQGAIWLRAFIFAIIDLRSDLDKGGNEALANASGLIRALVNGVLVVVGLIVILDNLGVNVTGLVAGLGIGGIAIGLAAQGIFSDLFASLSIIFDRPFRVGETINFGAGSATVERIGLKSTRLRASTGEKLIISNAQLLGKEIVSYAGLDRRRFNIPLGLIYQTSPEQAAQVPEMLREIVQTEGGSFIRAGFIGFGASTLDFEVEFDVMSLDYDQIYAIRHRIGLAILQRFNAEGIAFAYPTQTNFTADPQGRMILPYPPTSPDTAAREA